MAGRAPEVERHLDDDERRRRLARRHAVAPWSRVADPEAAARAVAVLHATEPASVHLACWARCDTVTPADVERALYEDRSLVKQLAMRRTLFAFPRDLLPAAWGSAAARTASSEGRRLAADVERAGAADDGAAWVEEVARSVLDHLADGQERDARTIRAEVPALETRIVFGTGKWSQEAPIAPRILTLLGARGLLVRGRNGGHWRTSRPQWTAMEGWLGEPVRPLAESDGYVDLVHRWLERFGPGTEDDLVWWLGATKAAVRAALVSLEAVTVSLDGGGTGYLLPDDVDPEPAADGPWTALLPVLDPTVMGWKGRGWYLGEHTPHLFDRNGNAGTTAWVDGRIVGCWVQDDDGVVEVRLLEKQSRDALRALRAEAERLTAWLDGVRVGTVYPSTAMKAVEWVHP